MKWVKGMDHPNTLRIAYYTASTLYEQGKLDEADAIQRETLLAQKRVLGEDHPRTIESATSLGRTTAKREKRDSAAGGGGDGGSGGGADEATAE